MIKNYSDIMTEFNQKEYNKFLIENKVLGFFEEPITLKSGRISNWYANCRDLLARVGIMDTLTDFVLAFASSKDISGDYFYGVPEGATKLGIILNYKKGGDLKLVMGRGKPKEHGAPKDKYFVGPAEEGDKVIVIEDVTTTGGSLINAIKQLKEAGIEVVAAIGLVNRMEKRDDGLSVEQAINELEVPYFNMGDVTEILPAVVDKENLSDSMREDIEKYFEQYGIKPLKLR